MINLINSNPPHGGSLVNRVLEGRAREQWLELAIKLPKIQLNSRQLSGVELISIGAFSPLESFMNQQNYPAVLADKRLPNGLPWTIPVALVVSKEAAEVVGKRTRPRCSMGRIKLWRHWKLSISRPPAKHIQGCVTFWVWETTVSPAELACCESRIRARSGTRYSIAW
jgi:hypothetical protein